MAGRDHLTAVMELAQQCLRDVPVVVVGSGLSCAHGLPSMGALAQELIAGVRPETPEEQEAWSAFRARLDAGDDLESALGAVNLPETLRDRIVTRTWEVVSEPDFAVRDLIARGRLDLPLTRLLRRLLHTDRERVTIVTTNYDRLAEYAADRAEATVVNGFAGGWIQRVVGWRGRAPRRQVQIFKVHGSLDWFADGQRVVGVPLAPSVPVGLRPLIVTPGLSKYRETHFEPFRSHLQAGDEALRRAEGLLCIGYGFNDEHVQEVLLERVRGGSPIVVLNRELRPAARSLLLDQNPKRYLFLERCSAGTRAWYRDAPEGVELSMSELWSLDAFLGLVEPRETN